MGRLLNFIIIDEFKTRRLGSIYFLTHWHSGTNLILIQTIIMVSATNGHMDQFIVHQSPKDFY